MLGKQFLPMGHVVYLDFIFVSAVLPCVNL